MVFSLRIWAVTLPTTSQCTGALSIFQRQLPLNRPRAFPTPDVITQSASPPSATHKHLPRLHVRVSEKPRTAAARHLPPPASAGDCRCERRSASAANDASDAGVGGDGQRRRGQCRDQWLVMERKYRLLQAANNRW